MKLRRGFFTFLAALIILTPLRIYRVLCECGVCPDALGIADHANRIIAAALFVFCVVSYVFAALSRPPEIKLKSSFSPFGGVVMGAIAAFTAFECCNAFYKILSDFGGQPSFKSPVFVVGVLEAVFGLLSVMYFCAVAVCFFDKKSLRFPSGLLSLSVPLWGGMRLVRYYMQLTTVNNDAENLYIILTMCAVAAFSMTAVRAISDVGDGRGNKMVFAYGYIMILAFFVCIVPKYVAKICTGGAFVIKESVTSDLLNLAFCLMAFLLLTRLYGSFKKELLRLQNIENEELAAADDAVSFDWTAERSEDDTGFDVYDE